MMIDTTCGGGTDFIQLVHGVLMLWSYMFVLYSFYFVGFIVDVEIFDDILDLISIIIKVVCYRINTSFISRSRYNPSKTWILLSVDIVLLYAGFRASAEILHN